MMQIQRTVGQKGQVVLPKDIRRHFNLRTGSQVMFTVQDGNIILKPQVDPRKFLEEFYTAGNGIKKRTVQEWKKIIEEQYTHR
ncbi:MAG: AbrB/MazE/SpoVT family DNA-binding domain-containing protein [Nanoarchaeota archaeon]